MWGAVYPLALNVSLLLALCCPRGTGLLVTIALVWVCDFGTVVLELLLFLIHEDIYLFLSPVLCLFLSAAAVSSISSTCETLSRYNWCWVNTQTEE